MNKNPVISVLLPVYNGERYLDLTIESILNQSFTDFEFIIIDDGSNDNTLKIISEYAKSDDRIVLMRNIKNSGIIKSLNLGLKKAKANIIARIDCGDISESARFKKQIDFLNKNEEYILVGSQSYFINLNNEIVGRSNFPSTDYDIRKELFLKNNIIIHPSVMYRKYPNVLYNNYALHVEDYDMWLRMAKLGKFFILNEYLIRIRLEYYGTSFSKRRQQINMVDIVHKKFFYGKQSPNESLNKLVVKDHKLSKFYEKFFIKITAKFLESKKSTIKWFFYGLLIYFIYPKMILGRLTYFFRKIYISKDPSFINFLKIDK